MKKSFLAIGLSAGLCLAAGPAFASEGAVHRIGVMTYNSTDDEQILFRNYLNGYIKSCFNVEFIYSFNVRSEEDALSFIEEAAEEGIEGIMSFTSLDLEKEVSLCEEKGIYFLMASGSVADDQFEAVKGNEHFLGVVGPGPEMEYQLGVDMAEYFVSKEEGKEFFILSGGAGLGNEMHRQRTMGILDGIQKFAGVSFETPTEELAASDTSVHAQAGDVTVCVTPGYLAFEEYLEAARTEYEKDRYGCVMSVLPGASLRDSLKDASVGIVDCFSENNLFFMEDGELKYVVGKYGSLIGTSFAAMYNAVTGYSDVMRENNEAFRIEQGFWTSTDQEDYLEKYALASSLEINAYNYEDLEQVCVEYNEGATLKDLKELASAYTYEEVMARRGL